MDSYEDTQKSEHDEVKNRCIKEFPTLKDYSAGIRYLEIFSQLMKLKPFAQWMKDNIEIHDQIDEENKGITTLVMFKGNFEQKTSIVRCPGCGVAFDPAEVKDSLITIESKIPEQS